MSSTVSAIQLEGTQDQKSKLQLVIILIVVNLLPRSEMNCVAEWMPLIAWFQGFIV